jgi:hypothetical protein
VDRLGKLGRWRRGDGEGEMEKGRWRRGDGYRGLEISESLEGFNGYIMFLYVHKVTIELEEYSRWQLWR